MGEREGKYWCVWSPPHTHSPAWRLVCPGGSDSQNRGNCEDDRGFFAYVGGGLSGGGVGGFGLSACSGTGARKAGFVLWPYPTWAGFEAGRADGAGNEAVDEHPRRQRRWENHRFAHTHIIPLATQLQRVEIARTQTNAPILTRFLRPRSCPSGGKDSRV